MADQAFFNGLHQANSGYAQARRQVISQADEARNLSKRAIFALHRDDRAAAADLLGQARVRLGEVRQAAEELPNLVHEGAYRAGLEEFVEARLFQDFLEKGAVGDIGEPGVRFDTYLAALADLTGELQRRQVRLATERDMEGVRAVKEVVQEIVGQLLMMDLSGYLRTKFDQAKNSLRRAEEVLYELSLRS
ncbi:hypothetical protein AMJ57_00120 [Parcubacteria bacterium SG8_24]|nr:MAG: hypothetical protein AMJ57_00120 [Parcubacteria bacterium SG8_24]